jgi:hypothetical protein
MSWFLPKSFDALLEPQLVTSRVDVTLFESFPFLYSSEFSRRLHRWRYLKSPMSQTAWKEYGN